MSHFCYPSSAAARTLHIIQLLLCSILSYNPSSSSSSSPDCKLYLASSAGSPRRHWYADSADNDIHCLHYSLVWEGTAVERNAHTDLVMTPWGFNYNRSCLYVRHTNTGCRTNIPNGQIASNKPLKITHLNVAFIITILRGYMTTGINTSVQRNPKSKRIFSKSSEKYSL